MSVVVPPPIPAPPVVEVVPVSVGVVAVVDDVVVEVVVVGVVVEVVVVGVVVLVVVGVDVVVGTDGVLGACRRQSCWASCAIVAAPWLRLLRKVGLTVTGRFWTSWLKAALALLAVPQFPDCTAALISLPCPLSDSD